MSKVTEIKANTWTLAEAFLDKARDNKSFVCPVCGRGGAGSSHKDGIKPSQDGIFGCFSCKDTDGGCKGSIIDVYCLKHNMDSKTAIDQLGEMLGFLPKVEPPKNHDKSAEQVRAEFRQLGFTPMQEDYRGISKDLLNEYGVKHCQKFKNPKRAGTFYGARQAVAFPTGGGNFYVRAYEHKTSELCDKWDIGNKVPFNLQALKSGRPVFVVEGVIDALSIIQSGGQAIALSGKDCDGLVAALKETPSPSGLLLALDNDEEGKKASADGLRKLKKIGVECEVVDTGVLFGGKKDANEALQADKDGLRQRIAEVYIRKANVINPWAGGITTLMQKVAADAYRPIPTGIKCIDNVLDDGFMVQQLVAIGAPPAMGKTAFCQWLIESMAMNKPDFSAMYICYEMSREQLQARGISRYCHEKGRNFTAKDILRGRSGWADCARMYQQDIGGKVVYMGRGSGLSTNSLKELLRVMQDGLKYRAMIGQPAPFIVVDYLQLVDAGKKDETETLKIVMGALKDFAVKHNTVIIGIMANNRASNKAGGVSMDSGRGSSSLEYGADIVLGLTYTELLDGSKAEEVTDKNKRSLATTKGRFFSPDKRADFVFNGAYSEFTPVETLGTPVGKKQEKKINNLLGINPME